MILLPLIELSNALQLTLFCGKSYISFRKVKLHVRLFANVLNIKPTLKYLNVHFHYQVQIE